MVFKWQSFMSIKALLTSLIVKMLSEHQFHNAIVIVVM